MGNYGSTPAYNPATDIPDLKGKVIIVTGANAGIGYETVVELVKHGAKVYMGARNESRATGAIAKLKADGHLDGPNAGEVVWLELDLSTPTLARRGAEEFMKRETRLDILVNNAGVQIMAPDAFEPVKDSKVTIGTLMATNHIGTFVFTNILLPLIKKTAAEPGSDVRVVTVSSFVHSSSPKTDWKTFEEWNPKPKGFLADLKPYGRSKLANILFAKQLQRNFDDEHVNALSICVAPGSIDTDTVRVGLQERSWFAYIIYHLTNLSGNFITPAQGAYTTLFAATSLVVVSSDESKGKYAASYLVPFGLVAQPTAAARDPDAARDLWATSERVVEAM